MTPPQTPDCNRDAMASFAAPTGSADWWAIIYEDADRKPELFSDEEAARRAFAERLVAWSCHLFRRVSPNDY